MDNVSNNETTKNVSVLLSALSYGSVSQYNNASDTTPVIFTAAANPIGNGTCNFTAMQSDRLMPSGNLWVQNGTGANITIASNGTTWVSFLCNATSGNYSIFWNLPQISNNCSGSAGFIDQTSYWNRSCVYANPSTTTNYSNATESFGCPIGYGCLPISKSQTALNSSSSTTFTQFAWYGGTPAGAIIECGTYNGNNTTYKLYTSIDGAGADCLVINGYNNSVTGSWLNVKSDGANAIVINGDGNTISNFTVGQSKYGILLNGTSNNNMIKWSVIRNSTNGIGINTTGNNTLKSNSIANNTYGINVFTATNLATTVLNLNLYNNTNDLNSSTNLTDGGYNYWSNCSGVCDWYTINQTSLVNSSEDTFTNAGNATINFEGLNTNDPSVATSQKEFVFSKYYLGQGLILSSINISAYSISNASQTLSAYYTTSNWNASNLTWNLNPTVSTSFGSAAIGTTWGWNSFVDSNITNLIKVQNNASIGNGIGVRLGDDSHYFNYNSTTRYTISQLAPTNSTKINYTWRYAIGNNIDLVANGINSTGGILRQTALSTQNATYCTLSASSQPTIYYTNGTQLNTTLYNNSGSGTGLTWTFACSPDTLYYADYNAPTFAYNGDCVNYSGAGINYTKFNFTTRDEENQSLNYATQFISVYLTASSGNYTAGAIIENATSAIICINPNSLPANVTINNQYACQVNASAIAGTIMSNTTSQYNASTNETFTFYGYTYLWSNTTVKYPMRSYFIQNMSLNPTNTTAYYTLFCESPEYARQTQFLLLDADNNPVTSAYITIQRYFTGNASYQTIGIIQTDSNGVASTYLRPNDIWYNYVVSKNGVVLQTFTQQIISCATSTCQVVLRLSPTSTSYWSTMGSIAIGCLNVSINSTTQEVTCQFVDANAGARTYNLTINELSFSSNATLGRACTDAVTGASGTLVCDINGFTGKMYTVSVYSYDSNYTDNNRSLMLSSLDYTAQKQFADMGIFPTLIVFLTLVGIGLYNPIVSMFLGVVGLILMAVMGFTQLSLGACIALIVVAILFAMKART